MQRLKRFITASIIGGFVVLIPITILYLVFSWLFSAITKMIETPTNLLMEYLNFPRISVEILVIVGLVAVCFLVGSFIQTRFGKFFHEELEQNIFGKIPGYKMLKGAVVQIFNLIGGKKFSGCPVALVDIFPGISTTAFITEDHENGRYTIFIPTAPNPVTGFICHPLKENVKIIQGVTIQDGFQTILACGIGSKNFFTALKKQEKIS